MTIPGEMYKGNQYRVVHSPEEAANFARLGWLEEMPITKKRSQYTVHTAVDEPVVKKEAKPVADQASDQAADQKPVEG